MKYKLINKQTNEEHLCDKVTIDGFDYYVSDEQPEKFCIRHVNNNPFFMIYDKGVNHKQLKIICTNNPNIDIPKVVDEVAILANIKYPFAFGGIGNAENDFKNHFIKGYNKSQATHPFSEEDMIEFADWIANEWSPNGRKGYWDSNMLNSKGESKYLMDSTQALLQLWKEQKPKIVYYE